MRIQSISESKFKQIDGARRVIVHDYPQKFGLLDLGESLGCYGLSWNSSSIIEPVTTISQDKHILWIGVEQRLAGINLQQGNICLSMSLHTPVFQILALDECTVVLTEMDVLLFNNSDASIRCLEGLPEIAADITVDGAEFVIHLLDENRLILNLQTLQLKEASPALAYR